MARHRLIEGLGPNIRFYKAGRTQRWMGEQEFRPNARCHGTVKGQTAGTTHIHTNLKV